MGGVTAALTLGMYGVCISLWDKEHKTGEARDSDERITFYMFLLAVYMEFYVNSFGDHNGSLSWLEVQFYMFYLPISTISLLIVYKWKVWYLYASTIILSAVFSIAFNMGWYEFLSWLMFVVTLGMYAGGVRGWHGTWTKARVVRDRTNYVSTKSNRLLFVYATRTVVTATYVG